MNFGTLDQHASINCGPCMEVSLKKVLNPSSSCGGENQVICTPEQTIAVDIQPLDVGEKVECKINGLTIKAKYKLWYEPTNGLYLTTPKSTFATSDFDPAITKGYWTVINWLEDDWVVWAIENHHDMCGDDCNLQKIDCQVAVILLYSDCFSIRKQSTLRDEDAVANTDDGDWVVV